MAVSAGSSSRNKPAQTSIFYQLVLASCPVLRAGPLPQSPFSLYFCVPVPLMPEPGIHGETAYIWQTPTKQTASKLSNSYFNWLMGGIKTNFWTVLFYFKNCSLGLKLAEVEAGVCGMGLAVCSLSMLPLSQNKSCEHKCLRECVLMGKWLIYRCKSLSHDTTKKECHLFSLLWNQRL